eukprot:3714781-Prymnesium_polylepis.1
MCIRDRPRLLLLERLLAPHALEGLRPEAGRLPRRDHNVPFAAEARCRLLGVANVAGVEAWVLQVRRQAK